MFKEKVQYFQESIQNYYPTIKYIPNKEDLTYVSAQLKAGFKGINKYSLETLPTSKTFDRMNKCHFGCKGGLAHG
ncbi:hypothetical protein [Desulfosporosinus sp.]|uniref:hypothetical protein n=1 Tax=Desulfosporosinus sp. TaxID=157907 RepID=UPI000E840E10|nr:hypothetical protein [Desulfosporosinus sp.]MBC2721200.1 hypothetical protein [Desulfosporosinus sp.]MBC2728204.1 hypothetical protein [Desulfosporosinus sp.]HBV85837.1 hypothetical protein [Desulfosporosinus sp.]